MTVARAKPVSPPPVTNRNGRASPRPAVFLDRDGTIIEERAYLSDPALVTLLPGAVEGLLRLRELGFALVLVTNQSGIGRGYYGWEALSRVHERMGTLLAAEGVYLDGIYICPHTPTDDCSCRKPRPGLVEAACRELGLIPSASFVIGDRASDVALGQAIGAAGSILVTTGYGSQELAAGACHPDIVAADLAEAARAIAGRMAARSRTPRP